MQRFVSDFGGGQIGVLQKCATGGQREVSAAADGEDALVGLDYFAGAGDQQQIVLVCSQHHGFQFCCLALTPLLSQLDGGAGQVAGEHGQLVLKLIGHGKGVGNGAGKADHHLAAEDAANLAGGALHDGVFAHGYLTVACDGSHAVLLHGADGGAAEGAVGFVVIAHWIGSPQ